MVASINNTTSFGHIDNGIPSSLLIIFATILCGMIAICAALNFICFILFTKNRDLLINPSNKFVFNFIIFSLTTSLTLMPVMLGSFVAKRWIFGGMLCQTISILSVCLPFVGLLTLAGIAFDRYHFIVNPLTYPMNMTSFKVNVIIFFVWFISIVSSLMPLFGWGEYDYNSDYMTCTVQWRQTQSFGIYFVLMAYLMPLFIQAFCYSKIIKVARKQAKFGRRLSRVAVVPMQVARIIRETSASKTIRKTVFVLGAFLITWTPMIIVLLLFAFNQKSEVLGLFAVLTNLLTFASSLVYPLVFVFRARSLRNEVRLLLSRATFFDCSNQVEPEVLQLPKENERRKSSVSLESYDLNTRRRSSKASRVSWALPVVVEDAIEPSSSVTASTITTDVGSLNLNALLPGESDCKSGIPPKKLTPKVLKL